MPPDLEAVCLKCLAKEPDERYGSTEAFAEDLGRWLGGEPTSVQPPGPLDALLRAVRATPELSTVYTWWAPLWLGGITLAQHPAVFLLTRTDQPAWALWGVMLAGWLGLGLVLWLVLFPRFRWVLATERHSILIAAGNLIAQVVLFLATGPLRPEESSRQVLARYPPLTVVTGLCFFILGSTHWGKFLPIGLATMGLALAVAARPEGGPLVFGVGISAWLLWWGLAKRRYFVPGAAEGTGRAG